MFTLVVNKNEARKKKKRSRLRFLKMWISVISVALDKTCASYFCQWTSNLKQVLSMKVFISNCVQGGGGWFNFIKNCKKDKPINWVTSFTWHQLKLIIRPCVKPKLIYLMWWPSYFLTFQVAWMHFEQSAILTVHNHVITRNPRISVTHDKHDKHRTWYLHIHNVHEEDKGRYMWYEWKVTFVKHLRHSFSEFWTVFSLLNQILLG